jgi:hypothetical protein
LENARLCISDCHDLANTDCLSEDLETADRALEETCAAMVDFWDAHRSAANPEPYQALRQEQVTRFKELRRQLDQLLKQKE